MKHLFLYLSILYLLGSCSKRPEYCEHMSEVQRTFLDRVAKPADLVPYGSGSGGVGGISTINLALQSKGKYTLSEARVFIVTLGERMKQLMDASEGLRPYLTAYPTDSRNLNLMVSFEPNANENYEPPLISLVSVNDRAVFYSYRIKGKWARGHTETYDEALQWVKIHAPCALEALTCDYSDCKVEGGKTFPPEYQHFGDLRRALARAAESQPQLKLIGNGETLEFSVYGTCDIPNARILGVALLERLKKINDDFGYPPFPKNNPAGPLKELVIYFLELKRRDESDPPYHNRPRSLVMRAGRIDYMFVKPRSDKTRSMNEQESRLSETYEEALEWVKNHAPHALETDDIVSTITIQGK